MDIIEAFATKNKCYQVTVCPTFGFIGCPTTYPDHTQTKASQGNKRLTRASYAMTPTVIMKGVVL